MFWIKREQPARAGPAGGGGEHRGQPTPPSPHCLVINYVCAVCSQLVQVKEC